MYLFNQSNANLLDISAAVSLLIFSGTFAVSALTVAQIGVRRNDRISIFWFSCMLGLFLWFLSEVTMVYYALVPGVLPPTPSLVDAFALVAYFPVMIGLLFQLWPFGSQALAERKAKIGLVVLGIVSVVTIYLLLPAIFLSQQGSAFVFVNLAYPILDLVTLFFAVPAFVMFGRGTFWRPALFLLIGLALSSAADIYTTYASLLGTYYVGHPVELVFDFGSISVALGFYLRRKQFLTKSI